MPRLVNTSPHGVGENILYTSADNDFRRQGTARAQINIGMIWSFLGHMEQGGLSTPGDAPIGLGLAYSGVSPGSPQANEIIYRAETGKWESGQEWDAGETTRYSDQQLFEQSQAFAEYTQETGAVSLNPGKTIEELEAMDAWADLDAEQRQQTIAYNQQMTDEWNAKVGEFEPEEEPTTFWEGAKGLSRGLFLAFDIVRDWADGTARSLEARNQGLISREQYLAGVTGGILGGEYDQEVQAISGMGFAGYFEAFFSGERLNMGRGLFAEGDYAEDVQLGLGKYYADTQELSEEDFLRTQARMDGHLTVTGLNGQSLEARSLDEWKWLRDTAGGARQAQMLVTQSPEQQALGMPIGRLQEEFYRRSLVATDKVGNYYEVGLGKAVFSEVLGLETPVSFSQASLNDSQALFQLFSPVLDFGKNIAEMGTFRSAGSGIKHVIGRGAHKTVGVGGEGGDQIRATQTAIDIVDGADVGARGSAINDLAVGTLNKEAAYNSIARGTDGALRDAKQTVDRVKIKALENAEEVRVGRVQNLMDKFENVTLADADNAVKRTLTEADVDDALRNVGNGQPSIVGDTLKTLHENPLDALAELNNLVGVQNRGGVSLIDGIFGKAVVTDPDVARRIGDSVDSLDDLLRSDRASVLRDPTNGKILVTYDADLGRAQESLSKIVNDQSARRGSRAASARRVVDAIDDAKATKKASQAEWEEAQRLRVKRGETAARQINALEAIPTYGDGSAFFHGSGSLIPERFSSLDARAGAATTNFWGPALYSTDDIVVTAMPGHGGRAGGSIAHLTWQGAAPPRILDTAMPLAHRGLASNIADSVDDAIKALDMEGIVDASGELKFVRDALRDVAQNGRRSAGGDAYDIVLQATGIRYEQISDLLRWVNVKVADVGRAGANAKAGDDAALAFNWRMGESYDAYQHARATSKGRQHTTLAWLRPERLKPTRLKPSSYDDLTGKGPSPTRLAAQAAAGDAAMAARLNARRVVNETIDDGYLGDLLHGDKALGIDATIKDMDKLRRLAGTTDAQMDAIHNSAVTNILNDTWASRRYAQKLFGDTPEAMDEYDNLVRVVRRSDSSNDLLYGVSDQRPRLDPDRLQDLFTGSSNSAIAATLDQLANATDHRVVEAVMRSTTDILGEASISPQFIDAISVANTRGAVIEVFMKVARGEMIVPPRITALSNKARYTNALSTFGGSALGGAMGFAEQIEAEGTASDQIGGAITGAIAGGLAGSAISGAGLGVFNKFSRVPVLNRTIDDIADGMDLLLAGTRAETAELTQLIRRARGPGVRMGRPLPELGIPQQLRHSFGHLAWGRRLMRHAPNNFDLNDPNRSYYDIKQWTRSIGLAGDEEIINLRRTTNIEQADGTLRHGSEGQKLLSSKFDSRESMEQAAARLQSEGWEIVDRARMNDVFVELSRMQANNPGAGWQALQELGKVADAFLSDAGMSKVNRDLITHFARDGIDDFIGNIDAVGGGANYAQAVINNGGVIANLDDGALMTSELWSGKVRLPDAKTTYRAMDQITTGGVIRQAFTGSDIWQPWKAKPVVEGEKGLRGSVWEELGKISDPETAASIRAAFTPTLERNVAMRTARAITGSIAVPAVLLTRVVSFVSRVLGEDQFRMAAVGLDNVFTHPINLFSAMVANFQPMRRRGALRGVAARSAIPDAYVDARTGKIDLDQLDNQSEWGQAEQIKGDLQVYDTKGTKGNKVAGHTTWDRIDRIQHPAQWKGGVATEYRQVVADPMIKRLANSKASDAPQDVLNWLRQTPEGQDVMRRFLQQFDTAEEASHWTRGDNLLAFLQDQQARMHLKTGGDYVFKSPDGVTWTTDGRALGADNPVAIERGFDKLGPGYHITRQGDPELLETVRTGKIKSADGTEEIVVGDDLSEDVWDALKAQVDQADVRMERELLATPAEELLTVPRFPQTVKGQVSTPTGLKELSSSWDNTLDKIYDLFLGRPSRVFSRQPVLGNYYWERVGMLLPMMDAPTKRAFRELALSSGITGKSTWHRVEEIGGAFRDRGMAENILSDFNALEHNAKAYAIERLNNTLFDLNRQRNFIDSTRLLYPFIGPMVEAFENWGRIIRRRPTTVWRRGGQLVREAWAENPFATQPGEGNLGIFHTDPETGEEMIRIPFSGNVTRWMHDHINIGPLKGEGIKVGPIDMRARGFNVVFGTEDLDAGEQPEFLGVPLPALDPGGSLVLQAPVHMFTKDREGTARAINDFMFPFGAPEGIVDALLPYHMRLIKASQFGDLADTQFSQHVESQWEIMVAQGEIGDSDEYAINLSDDGEIRRALDIAEERARAGMLFEGFFRGFLPTMVTPEAYLETQQLAEDGTPVPRIIKLDALAAQARELVTEEGAEWLETPDGYRISTEGDFEVATDYLNKMYNTNIFSAAFLDLPNTTNFYPTHYTETGRVWTKAHKGVVDDLPLSAHLLMANYAQTKLDEDYSFEAREDALARGDIDYLTNMTEIEIEIESMLLSGAYDGIEHEANIRFGPDDMLQGDEHKKDRERKSQFIDTQKDLATAQFQRGSIDQSQIKLVRDQLRGWQTVDWEEYNLTDEEMNTVKAVQWYWDLYDGTTVKAKARGQNNIADKGSSSDDQLYMDALRQDLQTIVDEQVRIGLETGLDMGNFVYIYKMYLAPEFDMVEEFDPLMALDMIRQGHWQVLPDGSNPENYLDPNKSPAEMERGQVFKYEPETVVGGG